MKVMYAMTTRNDQILRIGHALVQMQHECRMFSMDHYHATCTYIQKKLDEMGWKRGHEVYISRKRQEFQCLLNDFQPEVILFVNFSSEFFTKEELAVLAKQRRIVFWFVDELAGRADLEAYLPPYDVFVYEKDDVEYLRSKYAMNAHYCPVGYNDAYAEVCRIDKTIDVSFVGSPFKRRLKLLEYLAEQARRNHWKMEFYGPFYEMKYFWKKWIFKKKYPFLSEYVHNGSVSSQEAANIYARSKICLNIHGEANRSLNPRTFEILATGSFELVDAHTDYFGLVQPEQDLDCFSDAETLSTKVKFYLEHESEREKIAVQGKATVMGKYSMCQTLKKLLHT